MIEKRSPGWLRVLEILAGIFVLGIAFFVLADSSFALTVLAYTLGIGLLILGLSRIFASLYGRYFAPWFREVNAGGGLIALVLGIVVVIDPQLAIGFLALLVAFALLVVGIVEIVAAGFAKHPPVWVRGLIGVVGVLTVILSIFVILDSSLGQLSLAFIMAIVLVGVGVRDIAHGISGHRPVKIESGVVTKV
ncbi:MAG TPA: DUF308 domain-containing protein [Candidatus Sulfotelmatobacter sp.]|nr:DUF308 domain-containing protein [Candidatus Sulfotelmatobacter sp.]